MAMVKPLLRDEVPDEAKDVFKYEVQWQEPVPQKSGRPKNRAMVKATCPVCANEHSVPVNDVRNWIRGVRRQMPGTHRDCKFLGWTMHADGYRLLYKPDHPNANGRKYVAEHIYVMSEYLGRPLDTKVESVHHINGIKDDNELSNLQLRNRFHGKGQAWECGDCGSHNVKAVKL